MLSIQEQKKILKRQLELVKENQEQRKDIEFRDYRIMKLQKELEESRRLMLKLYEYKRKEETTSKHGTEHKLLTYERINIYG